MIRFPYFKTKYPVENVLSWVSTVWWLQVEVLPNFNFNKKVFLKKGWKWVIFFLLRPCQTLCMNVVSIIPTFRQILSVQTLSLWHTYCKKRLHKENFLESTSEEFLCIRTSGGDRQHSALPFCILSLMYSHTSTWSDIRLQEDVSHSY